MITDRSSHTELSYLASCEKQWAYRYTERVDADPTADTSKRDLGSAVHAGARAFWNGRDHGAAIFDMGLDHDLREHAMWLTDRYVENYTSAREAESVRMVGSEVRFSATVPGTRVELAGWFDNLALDQSGHLWLVERKTMGDWSRLDTLEVDPQIDRYVWLGRQSGLPIRGVLYDAILTKRWIEDDTPLKSGPRKGEAKAPPRPAEESFRALWLHRTDDQVAEAIEDVKGALRRRAVLLLGERPTRNIGRACGWCDFQERCWGELQFPYDQHVPLDERLA